MTVSLATRGVIQPVINNYIVGSQLNAELLSCSIAESCNLCSGTFEIMRGNAYTLSILVTLDGERLSKSELQAADNIIFVLKKSKKQLNADAEIYKDDIDGIIILDDTDSSNLQIQLLSDETNINPGAYFTALKIIFTSNNQQECLLINGGCAFDITNVSLNIAS